MFLQSAEQPVLEFAPEKGCLSVVIKAVSAVIRFICDKAVLRQPAERRYARNPLSCVALLLCHSALLLSGSA